MKFSNEVMFIRGMIHKMDDVYLAKWYLDRSYAPYGVAFWTKETYLNRVRANKWNDQPYWRSHVRMGS